ncbi:DUF1776-domain-containing protein [Phlyctema vagabunda]|uniref:DUF1776-domain-containing protein n=1 Tax=Phlyctema vagabunda TaxID=108571 RepID=A0ABR4PPP2_9HELO
MSADDQAFLDILSSVPNDVRRYSNEVADYIDKHIEHAAGVLREALSSSEWIPESARPRVPPRSQPVLSSFQASPSSTYTTISRWVSNNKFWTAVIVVAVGGVTYQIVRKSRKQKKRRGKRAANGARMEVVVIAGSPSEPLTRSIALDLERRGLIVYIVCSSIEEEVLVQNESRPDIKPLMIDVVDPSSARAAIERFTLHLQTPHTVFQGARSHYLSLRSLIIIPSMTYPSAPISAISPAAFADVLNTHLADPILTVQAFLPLLTSLPFSHSSSSNPQPKPSILLLTPSIIPSLAPAFHAPESSTVAGLSAFTRVLRAELSPLGIAVSQLQLGNFDISSFAPKNQLQTMRAETLQWSQEDRQLYGPDFTRSRSRLGRGSSLRLLNDTVFDAMVSGKGGVIRVGQGSQVYGLIATWVPQGLVGWMMGVRGSRRGGGVRSSGAGIIRNETSATSTAHSNFSSAPASPGTGMDEGEYISVHGQGEAGDEDEL